MKTKMILGIVMVLFLANIFDVVPGFSQPTGMIAHWKFDEGDGTVAGDSVDAYHGTIHGATWTSGKVNSALSFDGVDDYVDLGDVLDPRTSDWTIEAWTKTSEPGMPIDKYYSWGPPYYGFYWNYVNASRSDFAVRDTGGNLILGRVTENLIDGEWHHVAMVIDNTNDKVIVYVDGNSSATATGTINDVDTYYPLLFGRRWDDPHHNFWFNGLIDEIAVYNRALTFEEVQQRYIENGGNVVLATLGRYWNYDEQDFFVDCVSGVRTGYLRSRYDITPEGEVDVLGARIELETPLEPENFQTENIHPPCIPVPDGANWIYTWDFGDLFDGQGAMVSLPTNFEVDFDLGFVGQRIWNPWITSEFVTQTLTIVFNASTEFSDFHNVHVSVQIPDTPETSPSIDPDSVSASPLKDERGQNWTMWAQTDGDIEVNWGGDPVPGTLYTFSVDVTLQNMLFPEPIFYKPSAGFGANFAGSWSSPDTPCPKIADDINRDGGEESLVTYCGSGAFTWQEYAQSEHAITLPWSSFGFHEVYSFAEGRAFMKFGDELFRGPGRLRINKEPNTVCLSDPGHQHIFWWQITEYQSCGRTTILECIPTTPGEGDGDPGPAPIRVIIAGFEGAGRVAAFGRGINFTGKITGIRWPSP